MVSRFTESVKECKSESEHKQANGSAATTPTLQPHSVDGDVANSITSLSDGDMGVQTTPPVDSTISLPPDYHPRLPTNPVTHHPDDHANCGKNCAFSYFLLLKTVLTAIS